MLFYEKRLMWKFYSTNKTLITIKQVQIVNIKKSILVVLDAESKTFVMHVAIQEQEEIFMHSKT